MFSLLFDMKLAVLAGQFYVFIIFNMKLAVLAGQFHDLDSFL